MFKAWKTSWSLWNSSGGSVYLSGCQLYEIEVQIKFFRSERHSHRGTGRRHRDTMGSKAGVRGRKECKYLTDRFSCGLDAGNDDSSGRFG